MSKNRPRRSVNPTSSLPTPGPWRVVTDSRDREEIYLVVGCDYYHRETPAVPICEVSHSDAARIVEAVNAHEALRTARDGLLVVCRTAYDLLQHMTADSFSHGGDRVIRERLADVLERYDTTPLEIDPEDVEAARR